MTGKVAATQRWRNRLLELVEDGWSVAQACRTLSIRESTYTQARCNDKAWGAKVTAARLAAKARAGQGTDVTDLGTFPGWVVRYLGMHHNPLQLRIAGAIAQTKPGCVTMLNIYPEAGKSTTVLNYMTAMLARDANHRFALVSASQTLGRKFIGRLERRLTDTAAFGPLIDRYGPFREDGRDGKPWNADYFTVAKATHDEADPSVQALGWGSLAYGSRIDTLVLDDVQSRKTLSQTSEIYDNLRSTYFSRGKEMRIFVIGTRVGVGDVYEHMLDDGIVDDYICLPCANSDGAPVEEGSWQLGNTRTPQQNMEAKRKLVGEDAWHANYQQRPAASELSTFASYIDRALDRDRRLGEGRVA